MRRAFIFLTKHKIFPVVLATLISRTVWTPILFLLSGREFLLTAICNVMLIPLDIILLVNYKKFSTITSLTLYVLSMTFFCVFEATTTQIVCGMELCLYACIPGLFLFSTDKSPSRLYFAAMDAILVAAILWILAIKLKNLPPPQLFLPERRLFIIANEVFYTAIVLSFLLYGSLLTDTILRRNNKKTDDLQYKLEYIAEHDPLTGLMNRRRTHQIFSEIQAAKDKDNIDYGIAIFDIDNFKKINDTWGHDAGDFILKSYTKAVYDKMPESIRIGRWGGEEFVIIFPEIDDNTIFLLEEIRLEVASKSIIYDKNEIEVTATFGFSSSRNFSTPEDVLNNADEMLYIGKNHGKNRLVVSPLF